MTILITGATGLVGTALTELCLEEGYTVHYLTTRKKKIIESPNYKGFYWNPAEKQIDTAALENVSCIIHLAGASISQRWTKSNKKKILDSRIESANLLYDTLKGNENSVRHFISASGIGIYPSSRTKLYSEENTETGDNFLARVVVAWELAADRFKTLGIDVAKIRTGLVLSAKEGALPQMIKPIKLGLGAPLGSGKQWHSWIHIEDIARIYLSVIANEREGIFNAVAPTPVTNSKLMYQLARKLDAPYWLPNVPAFALKLALGEMSMLLLEGQLVRSEKFAAFGFTFIHFNLESALNDLL